MAECDQITRAKSRLWSGAKFIERGTVGVWLSKVQCGTHHVERAVGDVMQCASDVTEGGPGESERFVVQRNGKVGRSASQPAFSIAHTVPSPAWAGTVSGGVGSTASGPVYAQARLNRG
jgi:hypothetical protein